MAWAVGSTPRVSRLQGPHRSGVAHRPSPTSAFEAGRAATINFLFQLGCQHSDLPYAALSENEFIKQRIARGNVRFIWTSGRKCNFAGCDRPDLQPPNVNGWFWSGSGAKIGPTTQRNTGDWSYTGGYGQPQPDNREAAQGNDESCLSILNNFYNDGIKWHDVACHHVKPFVCEDSDELLNFVRSRNPTLRL
ncbi:hypothetical protein MSG28_002147 [Choristoneura fumiferana]|uniref:Uncharacterized protein n=1 Tax=Choristoneura fumiferana TaxID=7141 RepID=A0ACC0JUM7_CHOFU|nr:hypothetical protein MSG28_002147 [Choristoneura fumiferana]